MSGKLLALMLSAAIFFAGIVCPCPANAQPAPAAESHSCCKAKKQSPRQQPPREHQKSCPHCDGTHQALSERTVKHDGPTFALVPTLLVTVDFFAPVASTPQVTAAADVFLTASPPPLISLICSFRN